MTIIEDSRDSSMIRPSEDGDKSEDGVELASNFKNTLIETEEMWRLNQQNNSLYQKNMYTVEGKSSFIQSNKHAEINYTEPE